MPPTTRAPVSARRARAAALCQGIVRCGACGSSMATQYQRGGQLLRVRALARRPHHDARLPVGQDAVVVDELVARRLLAALAPEEIALALAAADEVAERRARSTRALELRVERARYEAIRAERAFHACEPENRLVARSLETRWEEKLRELKDAEAELAEQHASGAGALARADRGARARPARAVGRRHHHRQGPQAAAARDDRRRHAHLPARQPRAPGRDPLALRRNRAAHHPAATEARRRQRTPPEAIELIKRLAAEHTNTQIADQLNAAGMRTSTGRPFDEQSRQLGPLALQDPAQPAARTTAS